MRRWARSINTGTHNGSRGTRSCLARHHQQPDHKIECSPHARLIPKGSKPTLWAFATNASQPKLSRAWQNQAQHLKEHPKCQKMQPWDLGPLSVQPSTEPIPSLKSPWIEAEPVQGHDSGAPKGKPLARRRSIATPMIPIARRSKYQDLRSQQGPLWLYPSQSSPVCTSQKTTSIRSEAPLHPFENNGSPWSSVAIPCISYGVSWAFPSFSTAY